MSMTDPSIFSCFQAALQETVQTMSGLYVEKRPDSKETYDFAGVILLKGESNFVFFISTDRASACRLISYMTGLDEAGLDDASICDGMSELCNIVAGLSRAWLAAKGHLFSLSSPFCVSGTPLAVTTKPAVKHMWVSLGSQGLRLRPEILYLD